MDISKFSGLSNSFEEGIEIDITHPVTAKPLGMKVTVASYQSERVKAVQRRIANRSLKESKRNPKRSATVEELEETTNEILATAVLSWTGFELKGKPLECNRENVLSVISNPDLWFIREQIDKAADDVTAFMSASNKS
jgi:hypothetical protein